MSKDETKKINLKTGKKKKKANPDEPPKLKLISLNLQPNNPRLGLD
jgi:hypothetical protein